MGVVGGSVGEGKGGERPGGAEEGFWTGGWRLPSRAAKHFRKRLRPSQKSAYSGLWGPHNVLGCSEIWELLVEFLQVVPRSSQTWGTFLVMKNSILPWWCGEKPRAVYQIKESPPKRAPNTSFQLPEDDPDNCNIEPPKSRFHMTWVPPPAFSWPRSAFSRSLALDTLARSCRHGFETNARPIFSHMFCFKVWRWVGAL